MQQHTHYIIGAGAIGKALAVFLRQSGKQVCLVRASVTQQPPGRETIRVQVPGDQLLEATLDTVSLDLLPPLEGWLICTSKSHGNRELAAALLKNGTRAPLLLLQNGLGVESPFLEAGMETLFRSVLFATSQFTETGSIRFRHVADSVVGIIRGEAAGLQEAVDQLDNPFFPFRAETKLEPVIWTKAIVNSVFNSVCPLLETDNGIFTRHPQALELAKSLIRESVQVARKKHILLDESEILHRLLLISQVSSGQLISTYQDILQKRPTEIDSLNLALAREAQQLGIPEATLQTRLLGELVQWKAELTRAE